ncbi:hypothetical protein GCM10010344_23120 [Streptomyces bluensis]|nr:hypothetical protein GCM10010344_23120 [Streptomyces bluensis]
MQEYGKCARIGVRDLDAGAAGVRGQDADGHRSSLAYVVDDVRHQLADAEAHVEAVVPEMVAQFGDGLRDGEQTEFEGHGVTPLLVALCDESLTL